jgi:hypothetical protein
MRARIWMAIGATLLLAFGLGTVQAQTQPASQGQMDSMDMNHPKTADPGAGMDMGHCGGMAHCNGEKTKTTIPAGTLRITFAGKSADWTTAALAGLPHKTVTVRNSHTNANESYSGVPLIDLLERLNVPDKPHTKGVELYLAVIGADGYKVAYSLAEVSPELHDATVIVADAVDGKPLASDGPLKLVDTRDLRATRWVRNLAAIRVRAIQ